MPVRGATREERARLLLEMEGTGLFGDDWNSLLEGIGRADDFRSDPETVYLHILAIADKAAEEPSVDPRAPEQIIGYDDAGLPT